MTWDELRQRIDAMSPEDRAKPVYCCEPADYLLFRARRFGRADGGDTDTEGGTVPPGALYLAPFTGGAADDPG